MALPGRLPPILPPPHPPPRIPPEKLVFVQYLAALAICDGLDADGKLGVRLKWPNDIYAFAEGVGAAEEGKKGKAKLGGILVNSSFVDGQWRVVVGCGINILNDLPTTSLAQLHDLQARRKGTPGKVPSMEESLAAILVSFEGFWNTFLHDQGFDGLLDEYLGRWLHTDQPVTLTTTTLPQQLIIKTITLDHGLLRCVPDRRGEPRRSMYDPGSEDRSSYAFGAGALGRGMQALGLGKTEYVDLQPDGNSFDLMSGLIKRKV
ncbi:hypothetical protein QFC20_005057 [Naganishia adeliensis]|uniref:Uncharacterized protein n=1 Tax=Naganishia adeliensis TaxID=92952 RepID=A0ACC2VSY2_9TREE|nr:hypothetical protein QFC20_005057 [Naganishia adeliensis]